jgi:transcriptional regulator with XRE-family HTH domain
MTTWSLNTLNIAEQYTGVSQPGELETGSFEGIQASLPLATLVTATSEAIYPTYHVEIHKRIRDTLPIEVVARTTGAELRECSKTFLLIAHSSLSNSIQTSYQAVSFLPVETPQTRPLSQNTLEGQAERYSSQIQAKRLREISGLTIEQVANIFGVSRITFHKWMEGSQLSDRHREHLLEVLPLVEEALRRTGTPNALSSWLLTPVSPGGKKPVDYLSSRQYNTFRGFLIRYGANQTLLSPPVSLGITYRDRPREEVEDEMARLHPAILLDEDYPDSSDDEDK